MRRIAAHGEGTALIFARTETEVFHEFVWGAATAVLFLKGRLFFCRPDGVAAESNAGAPSCLVAYGEADAMILERLADAGTVPGHYVAIATKTTRRACPSGARPGQLVGGNAQDPRVERAASGTQPDLDIFGDRLTQPLNSDPDCNT